VFEETLGGKVGRVMSDHLQVMLYIVLNKLLVAKCLLVTICNRFN